MKGIPLIFFFLISILFFNPAVSGSTVYDSFIHSGSSSDDFGLGYTGSSTQTWVITKVQINNIATLKDMTYLEFQVPGSMFSGPYESDYDNVGFTIDGDNVGSGIFGYTYNPSGTIAYVQLWVIGGLDIGTKTGAKELIFTDLDISIRMLNGGQSAYCNAISGDARFAFFEYASFSYYPATNGADYYNIQTDYTQIFDFNYNNDSGLNRIQMDRDTTYTSKVQIFGSGVELYNESVLKTSDLDFLNITYDVWVVHNEDIYGDIQTKTLYFDSQTSYGLVCFNQSYYTSPEIVGIEYDIQNFDSVHFEYWILLTGTNNGIKYFVTTDYYDITTATGQDDFSISYHPLTLPFTMQAELWEYSRVSGVSSVLAYSSEVEYNPASQAPGSIWTDKDNYNISEIFYIQIDTNYNTVQIELISSDFYDLRTMEGPGFNYLGYLFNDPHNFTAYLIEDGIKTNYTDFTVSADTPFLNIHVDTVPVNQGFCFSYYTDNTSDTITGYRPDGSIFYGPTTNLITLEKVDICGPSSPSPAGIYTMSLLHDGVDYFNDTIVMSSAIEYIYFESTKYETGDRMIIHYYIMDRQQRIRLSDSLGTAVVTWTCDAFYITPNMGNSLWFSLIDNNEYGLNMNASIDAGTFRTGNWKVEIIGIDGKPLTDYGTYDYTTVNKKIDTPEDQTTEFILLIFSPEGIFLILTSVLMLAGLVAAKHPAGGAAGAAVGVGFGVFFGVLPVWMLLLMVILLVVLAGVGTAVHFKGK